MAHGLKQQLANTQKELEALKAEYNEFVYIVSHDLKAPLRQIEGFVEILSDKHTDDFDDKSKRHLDMISNGSNKASKLLDALVGYSRLNTQDTPFELIDFTALIAEATLQLLPLIESHNVKITLPDLLKTPNSIHIMGDKNQLTQLFYHVIHNAITYRNQGAPSEVVVGIEDKKDYWQLSINDNGIGIRENLTEKIFKVLRRGVSDKVYPGLGMGLALSSKILQRHNGNIWVESEKNIGSTFYFTLPKALNNG